MGCDICRRIENITGSPFFVCETQTGYVVVGDTQYLEGYTVFLSKRHITDMGELPPSEQALMMEEVFAVGDAVSRAFSAEHMNYALLGRDSDAGDTKHVHWHILPRRHGDIPDDAPYWSVPVSERNAIKYIPDAEELSELVWRLRTTMSKNPLFGGCSHKLGGKDCREKGKDDA